MQFGLVGFVLLPVTLFGTALTAWRGYRKREPVGDPAGDARCWCRSSTSSGSR